ncbi:ferritin heavy chain-like [Pteronotus mesoamericanus]|uniref:ferritin heavy chain-like n=1 Tax=Pteronotus mesoamericanus TaxID=1884717 RepID=UPI0023EC13BF|nr:ferritin heavy chain-like [Pteronotus parnellii mesoamericanus]
MGSLQPTRRSRRHHSHCRGVPRRSRHRAALALMATPERPVLTVAPPAPRPPAVMTASPAPEPAAVMTASPAPGPATAMMTSLWELQQGYFLNCQVGVNNQVNLELYTAYMYRSVASYFDGSNIALSEITEVFQGQSTEQMAPAERLMWQPNQQGGVAHLHDLNNAVGNNWHSMPTATECALCLAMSANQSLLDLQQPATANNDGHLSSVLQQNPLREQLTSIQQLGQDITFSSRPVHPEVTLAEYLRDRLRLEDRKN